MWLRCAQGAALTAWALSARAHGATCLPAARCRRFLDASPAAYTALQAANAGSADAVVLAGVEAAGGDVQLVASALQLQSLAKVTDRCAGMQLAM